MMRNLLARLFQTRVLWAWAVLLVLFILGPAHPSQGREITDMFGKKVSVPDRPQKVYSPSPVMTIMLYTIDPSMLAGLTVPVREWEKRYLRKEMQALPVLGGWFGQGNTPNLEMILKVNPEIIVAIDQRTAMKEKESQVLKQMPIPVVSVPLKSLSEYVEGFLYLGRVLGREERARKLAAYTQKTLSEMDAFAASVPAQKRVSVYYAEGVDGLSTECDTSWHAELIRLAGGRNVHRSQFGDTFGMEKISFEQVMLYNPEVILVMEDVFFRQVFSDPRWNRIKAVCDKKVYLIPKQPFNWFDRPPSVMRLIGAKWLASLLYPERYRTSITKDVQQFFQLFLDVTLTAEEAEKLVRAR